MHKKISQIKCTLFYGENYANNSNLLKTTLEHLATVLLGGISPCLQHSKQGIHQAKQEYDARFKFFPVGKKFLIFNYNSFQANYNSNLLQNRHQTCQERRHRNKIHPLLVFKGPKWRKKIFPTNGKS